MEHTTIDDTIVTTEIQNVCEDINECLAINLQTSWPKTTEYAGHNYGGCPVDSVDCCPEYSTCENHIVTGAIGDSAKRMDCNCNDGFVARTEDGYNYCFDVLECADANVCLQTSGENLQLICNEQPGTFSCECPPGTRGDVTDVIFGGSDINTLQCNNINECNSSETNKCGNGYANVCTDISDLSTIATYDPASGGDEQGFFSLALVKLVSKMVTKIAEMKLLSVTLVRTLWILMRQHQ